MTLSWELSVSSDLRVRCISSLWSPLDLLWLVDWTPGAAKSTALAAPLEFNVPSLLELSTLMVMLA